MDITIELREGAVSNTVPQIQRPARETPIGMGVQVVDEDSVGLTLAMEQPSSMRCTRRVPQNTSQCTTFQPQHRLHMFSFAGRYTLFDSQTLCVMLVNSAERHPQHGQRKAGGT